MKKITKISSLIFVFFLSFFVFLTYTNQGKINLNEVDYLNYQANSNSIITKSAFENAYNLGELDTCYGIVKLDGNSVTDSGIPKVWSLGGWAGAVDVTGYNWVHITNTNPNVATASYTTEGGKLNITFTPGKNSGTTKISVNVEAIYPHPTLGTWNSELSFEYTITNGSGSVSGTELGNTVRSVTYNLNNDTAIWGKNPYNGQYGEKNSIGVGIINDVTLRDYYYTYYYSFYAQEMLEISVGSYDTSIATVEAYEINSNTTQDDVGNSTMKGVGIKVTGLKAGETRVVVTPKFTIPTTSNGQSAYLITRTMPITVYIKVTGEKIVPKYELIYDTNGGAFGTERESSLNIVRDKQTNPEFTITDLRPVRNGHIFLGWANEKDASTADYNPKEKITLSSDNATKTIYAIWKEEIKEITGIEKNLIKSEKEIPTELKNNLSQKITYPNIEGKIIIPYQREVTLLYKITIKGETGAKYKVTDANAEWVYGSQMEGIIENSNKAEIYVTKKFTANDIKEDGKLENTATITPGKNDESSSSSTERTPAEEENPNGGEDNNPDNPNNPEKPDSPEEPISPENPKDEKNPITNDTIIRNIIFSMISLFMIIFLIKKRKVLKN